MYTIEFYKNESLIDGKGIFAGEFIPKGTIVYYYGSDDTYLSKNELQFLSEEKREQLFKYGVEDESGNWLVTDGDANHSCDANILSLFIDSQYCDIAVKDIHAGEEITIDYGLFYSSFPWNMTCKCHSSLCRKIVGSGIPVDTETQELWHSRISEAAGSIFDVKQKLFFIEDERAKALTASIKSKINPRIFPYTKFSLISTDMYVKAL
jgi:SET domain-containing protein